MSSPARRSALAALDAARPAIARLDVTRDAEDLAADLIEGWNAVETALRSLVGGGASSGQALIRDARQRQMLTFEQANALAEFNAAAERAHRTDYQPGENDVNAARDGFLKFESSLMSTGVDAAPLSKSAAAATKPVEVAPRNDKVEVQAPARWRNVPSWAVIAAVLVVIAGLGIGGWLLFGRGGGSSDALDQGIAYYRSNQREAAAGAFSKAARDNPNDPLPHVYLSRMAREVGNYSLALQEAQAAVTAGPNDHVALREMGSYLLTVGNYDVARRFYIRAIQADTSDRDAKGWLGCTLARLGNQPEAMKWGGYAGAGQWTACIQAGAAPLPGTTGQPQPLGVAPRP